MRLVKHFILGAASLLALHITAQTPKRGLIASYLFSGNTKDGSGNGRNGTAVDLVSTPDRFGKQDSAYFFNGTSSYVQIADPASVNLTEFTLSAWYKTTSSSIQSIVSKQVGTPSFSEALSLGMSNGIVQGYMENIESVTLFDTSASNDGKWHHVVFVKDKKNEQVVLYVDNKLRSELTNPLPDFGNTGPIRLGSTSLGYLFWDGALDDIFFYNRSLDAKGVDSLYLDKNRVLTNITGKPITKTFILYPNPASSLLHLNLSQFSESTMVKINNSQAQTVYSAQITDPHSILDISQIGSKGLYYVQLFDGSNQLLSTSKLMID